MISDFELPQCILWMDGISSVRFCQWWRFNKFEYPTHEFENISVMWKCSVKGISSFFRLVFEVPN